MTSVIIVSWNVKNLLKACLASIVSYSQDVEYEIIVVDNNSHDGTAEMVRSEFPNVKIITNDFNAGFSRANNMGLAKAAGDHVLFMNPDMEFTENTLIKMRAFIDSHPDVFIATTTLTYGDGTRQNNIKRLPDFWSQALIMLKLHHLFSWLPAIKNYLAKDFDYSVEQPVENIMGAFVYSRSREFRQFGSWNEKFPLWWEDVDLCKRAALAGKKIFYTPSTRVVHHEGRSFAQVASPAKQKKFIRGMLIYFRLYHPIYDYLLLALLSPKSMALAYIANFLHVKPRTQSKI
ncbi:MAG: glycosyltransferase family 2 protein [Patescibacteria group bacterium]|nr:glycosyltransferase family 2 protein [Patescibacteria group bacterium]